MFSVLPIRMHGNEFANSNNNNNSEFDDPHVVYLRNQQPLPRLRPPDAEDSLGPGGPLTSSSQPLPSPPQQSRLTKTHFQRTSPMHGGNIVATTSSSSPIAVAAAAAAAAAASAGSPHVGPRTGPRVSFVRPDSPSSPACITTPPQQLKPQPPSLFSTPSFPVSPQFLSSSPQHASQQQQRGSPAVAPPPRWQRTNSGGRLLAAAAAGGVLFPVLRAPAEPATAATAGSSVSSSGPVGGLMLGAAVTCGSMSSDELGSGNSSAVGIISFSGAASPIPQPAAPAPAARSATGAPPRRFPEVGQLADPAELLRRAQERRRSATTSSNSVTSNQQQPATTSQPLPQPSRPRLLSLPVSDSSYSTPPDGPLPRACRSSTVAPHPPVRLIVTPAEGQDAVSTAAAVACENSVSQLHNGAPAVAAVTAEAERFFTAAIKTSSINSSLEASVAQWTREVTDRGEAELRLSQLLHRFVVSAPPDGESK